jgi:hypothetical protein
LEEANVHILHIAFSAQSALREDVVHMLGHDGALAAKKHHHLGLR